MNSDSDCITVESKEWFGTRGQEIQAPTYINGCICRSPCWNLAITRYGKPYWNSNMV